MATEMEVVRVTAWATRAEEAAEPRGAPNPFDAFEGD